MSLCIFTNVVSLIVTIIRWKVWNSCYFFKIFCQNSSIISTNTVNATSNCTTGFLLNESYDSTSVFCPFILNFHLFFCRIIQLATSLQHIYQPRQEGERGRRETWKKTCCFKHLQVLVSVLTGEKPFECPNCHERFARNSTLKCHLTACQSGAGAKKGRKKLYECQVGNGSSWVWGSSRKTWTME